MRNVATHFDKNSTKGKLPQGEVVGENQEQRPSNEELAMVFELQDLERSLPKAWEQLRDGKVETCKASELFDCSDED